MVTTTIICDDYHYHCPRNKRSGRAYFTLGASTVRGEIDFVARIEKVGKDATAIWRIDRARTIYSTDYAVDCMAEGDNGFSNSTLIQLLMDNGIAKGDIAAWLCDYAEVLDRDIKAAPKEDDAYQTWWGDWHGCPITVGNDKIDATETADGDNDMASVTITDSVVMSDPDREQEARNQAAIVRHGYAKAVNLHALAMSGIAVKIDVAVIDNGGQDIGDRPLISIVGKVDDELKFRQRLLDRLPSKAALIGQVA